MPIIDNFLDVKLDVLPPLHILTQLLGGKKHVFEGLEVWEAARPVAVR